MTTWGVVALVVGILTVNGVLWFFILRWLRGRLRRIDAELRARIAASPGERFLLEPAMGSFRGATARFGRVKGTSLLALTDRRLLFVKASGGEGELSLAELRAVREETWFLGSAVGGRKHLVVTLADGCEVGFLVADHPRWLAALRERTAAPPSS
jgi:hypothetical protein